jgi:hypothetical protein
VEWACLFCKRSHRKLYACIFGYIFRLDISLWDIFASAPCARLTSLVLPPTASKSIR